MCELSVGDERQHGEHEEGARWNENKLTGCHKKLGQPLAQQLKHLERQLGAERADGRSQELGRQSGPGAI